MCIIAGIVNIDMNHFHINKHKSSQNLVLTSTNQHKTENLN
jgi:hypothetical protein